MTCNSDTTVLEAVLLLLNATDIVSIIDACHLVRRLSLTLRWF